LLNVATLGFRGEALPSIASGVTEEVSTLTGTTSENSEKMVVWFPAAGSLPIHVAAAP
jgi:DNA mismatch repair ATPase MutL